MVIDVRYASVKGTRKQAQAKLTELLAALGNGSFVEPSKLTVAAFVRTRVDQWEAAGDISARTAQRYRQLTDHQIAPHIGGVLLQKLRPLDVEDWHSTLRNGGRVRGAGGLATRTIRHAHRVLGKALRDAVRNEMISRNVASGQSAPRLNAEDEEITIVHDVPLLIRQLTGWRYHVAALVSLFTGMRLGEVLALRWNGVDLDGKIIKVREALELTKAYGLRFKKPKTKAGRRNITLPVMLVSVLREHRKAMLEHALRLGIGKLAADALMFAGLTAGRCRRECRVGGVGALRRQHRATGVTFHALRHTHASQLIDVHVDIVTISNNGWATPSPTRRCASTRTCSARMTARQRQRSMRH